MLRPSSPALGFFRGEYHWETDRLVPSLDARLRVLVDHHNGIVTSEQVQAVERCSIPRRHCVHWQSGQRMKSMLRWVEGYRNRHPEFRGKPIAEKPFSRGCELKSVLFPSPGPAETKSRAYDSSSRCSGRMIPAHVKPATNG